MRLRTRIATAGTALAMIGAVGILPGAAGRERRTWCQQGRSADGPAGADHPSRDGNAA